MLTALTMGRRSGGPNRDCAPREFDWVNTRRKAVAAISALCTTALWVMSLVLALSIHHRQITDLGFRVCHRLHRNYPKPGVISQSPTKCQLQCGGSIESIQMRDLLVAFTNVIMASYILYRGFTTLVILPFTASLFSPRSVYFLLLILLSACATVLSYTRHKGIAASLAALVGLVALGSWCRDIIVAPVWTWSNFKWFVVPEVCFSLAVFFSWSVQRPQNVGSR